MSYKDQVISNAVNKSTLQPQNKIEYFGVNNILKEAIQQYTVYAYFVPYNNKGNLQLSMVKINYHQIQKTAAIKKRKVQIFPYFKQKAKDISLVQLSIKASPNHQENNYYLLQVTLYKHHELYSKRLFLFNNDWLQQEDQKLPIQMQQFVLKNTYKSAIFHPFVESHVIVLTNKQIMICHCQAIQNQLLCKKLQDLDIEEQIIGFSFLNQSQNQENNHIFLMGSGGNLYIGRMIFDQQTIQITFQCKILMLDSYVDKFSIISTKHQGLQLNLMIIYGRSQKKSKQTLDIFYFNYNNERIIHTQQMVHIQNQQYLKQHKITFFQLLSSSLTNGCLLFLKYHQILILDIKPFLKYLQISHQKHSSLLFPHKLSLELLVSTLNTQIIFIHCPNGHLNMLLKGKKYMFISEQFESLIFQTSQISLTRTISNIIQKTQSKLNLKLKPRLQTSFIQLQQLKFQPIISPQYQIQLKQTIQTNQQSLKKEENQLQILENKANQMRIKFEQTFHRKQLIKKMLCQIERNETILKNNLMNMTQGNDMFQNLYNKIEFVNERGLQLQRDARNRFTRQMDNHLSMLQELSYKIRNI